MNKTKIDWCDSTWNPVTGCLHGCEYCYARGIAERFKMKKPEIYSAPNSDGNQIYELNEPMMYRKENEEWAKAAYPYGFSPTFHRYHLNDYMGKQGRNIFVCSMADLFGDWVPDSWIEEVFKACEKAPQHNYLFLTKNPERFAEYSIPIDKNLWYGTSICKKEDISKCKYLPLGGNKFVSIEPILEDLEVAESSIFNYVDWFIIGAETGRKKGKVVPERKWIEDIVKECRKENVPVFMKSSLAEIWGEPLIQELPKGLKR